MPLTHTSEFSYQTPVHIDISPTIYTSPSPNQLLSNPISPTESNSSPQFVDPHPITSQRPTRQIVKPALLKDYVCSLYPNQYSSCCNKIWQNALVVNLHEPLCYTEADKEEI